MIQPCFGKARGSKRGSGVTWEPTLLKNQKYFLAWEVRLEKLVKPCLADLLIPKYSLVELKVSLIFCRQILDLSLVTDHLFVHKISDFFCGNFH